MTKLLVIATILWCLWCIWNHWWIRTFK